MISYSQLYYNSYYLKRKDWRVTRASGVDDLAVPKTVVNYEPDVKAFHGVFGVTGYGQLRPATQYHLKILGIGLTSFQEGI